VTWSSGIVSALELVGRGIESVPVGNELRFAFQLLNIEFRLSSNNPGANPAITSYVRVITSSLMRLKNENIFSCLKKRPSLLHTTLALYLVVNLEVVGLDPGHPFHIVFSRLFY
jgi:hypothetical protein